MSLPHHRLVRDLLVTTLAALLVLGSSGCSSPVPQGTPVSQSKNKSQPPMTRPTSTATTTTAEQPGSQTIPVHARKGWNHSNVMLTPGAWALEVPPNQIWHDLTILADPQQGIMEPVFFQRLCNAFKRMPSEPYFTVVAKVGRRGTPFRVSGLTPFTVAQPGELMLAPNDVPLADINNSGVIEVRLSQQTVNR